MLLKFQPSKICRFETVFKEIKKLKNISAQFFENFRFIKPMIKIRINLKQNQKFNDFKQ
jgi:hypothetical protein